MGNCASQDTAVIAKSSTFRYNKEFVIHDQDAASGACNGVKGIIRKDGANKLRTLSRVSWRDLGDLAGAALPEGLGDCNNPNGGMLTRLTALGPPDAADVAAELQMLKLTSLGSAACSSLGSAASGDAATDATDAAARAADGVLAILAVGASSLSQRAATARADLQAWTLSSGDGVSSSPDVAMNVAAKLEGVAAAAADAGRTREALALCLHAHTLQSEALGADSPESALCLARTAHVLVMLGRLQQAELLAKHAAHQTANGFDLGHRAPAEALMLCGEVLGLQGRFEESRAHLSCALELYVNAVGRQSAEAADIYMRLGELHRQRLLYDEAARLFRQSLNTRKRVLGAHHADTLAAMEALAGIMYDNKQYSRAEQMYMQLLQLHADLQGGPAAAASPGAVAALSRLAAVQAADERGWEAEATLKRAQAAAAKLYGTEHPVTQGLNLDLARLLISRKDANEVQLRAAEQLLRTSLRPAGGRGGGGGGVVAGLASGGGKGFMTKLSSMRRGSGTLMQQLSYSNNNNNIYSSNQQQRQLSHSLSGGEEGGAATLTADAQVLLSELVGRRGRHEEAERLLGQALDSYGKLYGSEHPLTARCMTLLAAIMAQRGRAAAGEPLARRALAATAALHGDEHPAVAACLVALGDNLVAKADHFEAHSAFRAAHRILAAAHGPEDDEAVRVAQRLQKLEADADWTAE